MERQYIVHDNPARHTNPHDHDIMWVTPDGHPEPQGPINYPDRAPEFKSYEGKDKNVKHLNEKPKNVAIPLMKCWSI